MSHKRKILQGSASNMARVLLSMLVAMVLPPLLVHRMAPPQYSAWVLILQVSAYINLLDVGLQTAIGKFVAEFDSLGDRTSSGRILSSSFVILCVTASIGAVAIGVIAWRVPQLFQQMPISLIGEARDGILLVGLSTAIALPFSAFLAAFTGLQMYGFPTALAMVSKILVSATLATLLLTHGRMIHLAWAMAAFNLATAAGQFFGWRKYAKERVQFYWKFVNIATAMRLAKYGSVLSIWTVASLLISGLDLVIVGHYDYKSTGYYGIASQATNFMVLLIASFFGPLLPAISSLQSARSSGQIGDMTMRATRYCALLICLVGLPLIFGAFPLLKFWVGTDYARRSALFLEVLVFGNLIRQLGYPYALVVVATGKQHLATIAGVSEALVNIGLSIYLVTKIGAVGVAIGTVVGAVVSLGMHLFVSMRSTRSTIEISRRSFVLGGLLRPLSCVIPSILLVPFWKRIVMLPANPLWIAIWILSTLGLMWFVGLTTTERDDSKESVFRLLYKTKV
jgi:O-antigen/teichoic acid export membrane protein